MSVLSVRNHRAVEKNHSPRNSIHGGQIQRRIFCAFPNTNMLGISMFLTTGNSIVKMSHKPLVT